MRDEKPKRKRASPKVLNERLAADQEARQRARDRSAEDPPPRGTGGARKG